MDEILSELGLTALEIRIYKVLLIDGPDYAGKISRKTGAHRRNVYDALERLIEKGLVSYIKQNNLRLYAAANPETVLEKLNSRVSDWKDIMPDLKKHTTHWDQRTETLFYRGVAGIKQVFFDQIASGKEVLVFGTNADVTSIVKYFFPKYQLLRKEKRIPTRMILDSVSKKNKQFSTLKTLPLSKIKFIDKFNSSEMSQYVYGDTVATVIWSDEEPVAIVIRHPEVSKGLRERFEILWSNN